MLTAVLDETDRPEYDYDEDAVDTDMLPTLLVYHNGQLVHNWVRVDWEAGEAGIEELLAQHRVLPRAFTLDGDDNASDGDDFVCLAFLLPITTSSMLICNPVLACSWYHLMGIFTELSGIDMPLCPIVLMLSRISEIFLL